ncbi:flagellar hook-basal body complex protein FliE [Roseinatronobacter sp.]|uniref:flagellar hook-basal body complex protein FliE n=1 Tax=Roseinatronobacter sp. TaxID=1945755 RepID=UPI0025EAD30C|nr:flagellar hook-basal body complex protein FliE [Rhodobaca sp.]
MTIHPTIASNAYNHARMAAAPMPTQPPARSEASFGAALGSFVGSLHHAEMTATNSMVSGADPHALVEALAATELAVETAVAVRNKVVEAYLEILRMPV